MAETWVYTCLAGSPLGVIALAATDRGLCRLALPGEGGAAAEGWLGSAFRQAEVVRQPAHPHLALARTELAAYFAAGLREWKVPLDLRGTPFQLAVWEALRRIPFGQTRSYAEVARAVGSPGGARAVGGANHANPVSIIVPCHRVITATGGLGGYGGGPEVKQWLLAHEQPQGGGAVARPRGEG